MNAQQRRQAADHASDRGLSIRRGCALAGVERSTYYYEATPRDDSSLEACLKAIAKEEPRYGYRRAWFEVNQREKAQKAETVDPVKKVNKKRVYRVWRKAGLCLPRRKKRKKKKTGAGITCKAECPNHVWAYDFIYDKLSDGRQIKLLTVEDEYTREGLAIHVAMHITHKDVICILADLFERYGNPAFIRSDNGPEFVAAQLKTWLALRGTETLHIDAGSPWQNGFIESFNSKVRDEFLNLELFLTLREAQVKTEMWRNKYNTKRPHMSLDYRTPAQERERFFTGALPPNPRSLAL